MRTRSAARNEANRPSKRGVIIDADESTNEQPAEKSVKIEEEPVPSSEMIELQQKNRKLEENLQRASRAAREAEMRAEAAESRLDSKLGINDDLNAEKERADDLEERVNDLTILLDTERREASDDRIRNQARLTEVSRENESLKIKINDMTQELHQSNALLGKVSPFLNVFIERSQENISLKTKINDMTKEHQQSIDELKCKLAQSVNNGVLLNDIGHPTNIFQLCSPASNQSISYADAREKLLSSANEIEGNSLSHKLGNFFTVLSQLNAVPDTDICPETFECDRCKSNVLTKSAIILHFLGNKHKKKVNGARASVSRAALEFWLGRLQLVAAEMAKRRQENELQYELQQQAKDAAAAAARDPRMEAQVFELLLRNCGLSLPMMQAFHAQPAAAAADSAANVTPTGI